MYTAEQVLDGFIKYVDNEVLEKMDLKGKILLGTGISLMMKNASGILQRVPESEWARMIGITDENGMYDVDTVADSLKSTMEKYGKLQLDIPVVGRLSFLPEDVTLLKQYIKGDLK